MAGTEFEEENFVIDAFHSLHSFRFPECLRPCYLDLAHYMQIMRPGVRSSHNAHSNVLDLPGLNKQRVCQVPGRAKRVLKINV